jgi:hypothetical protein
MAHPLSTKPRSAIVPTFWRRLQDQADDGAVTAEYAIALVAAAGFAGLLVTLLTSETARGWLTNIIESALSL